MTRRDMIIIAILVNAGLLAVLFMMAINSDTDTISDPIPAQQAIAEVPITPPAPAVSEPTFTPPNPADEGDNALKEFTSAPAPLPVIVEENITAQEVDDSTENLKPAAVEAPAPTAKSTAPSGDSEQKIVEVTVKRGDSLDKIARANGTSIKAIKQANKLTSSRLDIGQVLKVPVGDKKKSTAQSSSTPKPKVAAKTAESKDVASSDIEYYTIKSGDNPWKIARQFHIKVDDLLKLNNLNEEKARNLKAGDKIRVK